MRIGFVPTLCLMAAVAVGAPAAVAQPPNVVIILADDLGYGDLSSYGADDLRSPHVDQLMSAGLRFDRFYANCPVCSPTRAALLTGRYPELVGVPGVIRTHADNSWGFLDPDTPLLAASLKTAGYHTAIVGKWHLGLAAPNRPNERGFDHFHGFLGDMMDDYYHHRRHDNNYMRHNEEEIDPEGHATDLFSQWACDYLRSRVGKAQPFFLYLAYNAPHTPIQPPTEWLQRVREREAGISEQRAKLVALIEHMDEGIGQVMSTLKQTGLSDNTLVIFTSDNGGQLSVGANNGAWRDGKQSMYEGGLLVPACAVWPGKIAAGRRTNARAITMDLFPTVLEIAGAEVTGGHPVDGVSLAGLLTGEKQDLAPRSLFFTRREGGQRYQGLTIQAVRDGPWKLLQNSPFAPPELYHLERDPDESDDLISEERAMFRKLSSQLQLQIQRGGQVPWQRPASR